jgi:predicted nucleic acid-binding protein
MTGAAALEHGFTLVTRNLKDFMHMGVKLVNPWG